LRDHKWSSTKEKREVEWCLWWSVELIFFFALWLRRYATILSINETLLVLIKVVSTH
jgi:hypothetical protein